MSACMCDLCRAERAKADRAPSRRSGAVVNGWGKDTVCAVGAVAAVAGLLLVLFVVGVHLFGGAS